MQYLGYTYNNKKINNISVKGLVSTIYKLMIQQ